MLLVYTTIGYFLLIFFDFALVLDPLNSEITFSASKVDKVLGFKNLKGYETRIYAYLAEIYLSFWFKKYARSIEWPWVFVDLTKLK